MIDDTSCQLTENELEDAIRRYKRFYHLNVTGKLDDQTIKKMNEPRCGNPDSDVDQDGTTSQENSTFTYFEFLKRNLTYYIRTY